MPLSMFTMKTERVNSSERMATRPSPTTMESNAMSTGTRPATTAPKTRMSTTSAAGRPKKSSPCSRSRCDSVEKSFPTVCSPVTATSKSGDRSARSTIATIGLMSESPPTRIRISAACRSFDTGPPAPDR